MSKAKTKKPARSRKGTRRPAPAAAKSQPRQSLDMNPRKPAVELELSKRAPAKPTINL